LLVLLLRRLGDLLKEIRFEEAHQITNLCHSIVQSRGGDELTDLNQRRIEGQITADEAAALATRLVTRIAAFPTE
jgi:hypothetical protein